MQNRDQPFFILGLLLLIISILTVYAPVMQAGFILDDKPFYIEDPSMDAADGLVQIWLHPHDNKETVFIINEP